jgi:hypothetical protein
VAFWTRDSSGWDGGLLNGLGTFGYVWANYSGSEIIVMGKGQVPGHTHGMSSTRTELCVIFAALLYLQMVTTYHHLVPAQTGTNCTVYWDSKAALQRISDLSYVGLGTTWQCRANYDLEAAIKACLQCLRMQLSWKWGEGHASRRKKPSQFTWAETHNDHADKLATAAREVQSNPESSHWPEQNICIEGPRGRISGWCLDQKIWYCCTATYLLYWKQ